ncbi:MAG TPA: hypothetical protein VFG30_25340 [Polyangiales bacterium]|nr:hypothetical protein [Polyangiales bacterium]
MRLSSAWFLSIALFTACSDHAPQDANGVGASGSGPTATLPVASGGVPATGMVPPTGAMVGGRAGASGSAVAGGAGGTAMGMPSVAGSAGAIPGTGGAGAAGSGGMTASAGNSAGAGMSAGAPASSPVEVGHPQRFIASVHGGNADKLVYVVVGDPKQNWELAVPDGIQDFQLIGNNKLLVGYKFNFGYLEVDLATHKIDLQVRDFLTRDQAILTSVKRLASGHTLIMAQRLEGSAATDLEVWEVDNDKKVYEKRTFKGCCGNLRVVRLTAEGHFLVGADSALVELDETGKEVARMTTGGSPTYMGLKTSDGSYYATNGHGGQLLAFASGGQRRVVGGKGSVSAQTVTIYQPGQFQILQNGHIVMTNWTAENGGKGQQLVEYDPEGNLVWSWDDPVVRPQGMETLVVLDNLDPAVLNDDRDGVLKPQH